MNMASKFLTDAQVEEEIERLSNSDLVKLAKRAEYVRNRRRQYLYTLRCYEKKGRELAEAGISIGVLNSMLKGCDNDN
jgi:hypothetical protein